MKIVWFHLVVSAVLAHALSWAQQPSSGSSHALAYEDGCIENNIYTNECFGFSFAIPDGWQINTQILGADAKARHTTQGALVLVLIDQQKEGAFGSTIVLNAYDAGIYDKTVREFVSRYARGYVSSDQKHRKLVKDAHPADYAGKTFFRADNKQTMSNGRASYRAFVYTKFRGYYIGEFLSAASPGELELAVSSLQGISFREDKPNPKCVMRGDDNPSSGGVIGGVLSSKPPQSNSGQPLRIRVSTRVWQTHLITKVEPQYPDDAKQARIQGQVVLHAMIDKHGDVEDLTLVSGHPMLIPAAIEAVKQWKYKPYLLNGQPTAVETQIAVDFQLSGR